MYDHIRLGLVHVFGSEEERREFCERYLLYEEVKQLRSFNNGAFKDLKQNRGVYIKMKIGPLTGKEQRAKSKEQREENKEKRTKNKEQREEGKEQREESKEEGIMAQIVMSFSLHKFYNFTRIGEYLNWDDFSMAKANRAKGMFMDFFPMLNFAEARVTTYEVGVNIQLPRCPDDYFEQMVELQVKERTYPIIHDRHEREFKQYGTTTKGKRISYVWYNKTYEARSKMRSNLERYVVPENIMRCEKDNRVPIQRTMFMDLFKKDFQKLTANEFRKRFVDDIFFAERVPKLCHSELPELSKPKLELLKEILNGARGGKWQLAGREVMVRLERDYKAGRMAKRTYYRRLGEIKEVMGMIKDLPHGIKNEYVNYEQEYKTAVAEKIAMVG